MFDFLKINKKWDNKSARYVYSPSFEVKSSIKDLMVRGGKFYAIYNEATGLWETEDPKAVELIDSQIWQYVVDHEPPDTIGDKEHGPIVKRVADTSNGLIKLWHQFCEKDYQGNWHPLNQKVIFSNTEVKRSDYASVKLDYPIEDTPTPYYDKLCERLYLPSESEKWEWFIGCILAGDQRKIQKMLVFYGEPGTGKSTIIGKVLAENMFGGYTTGYAVKFEANNLVGRDNFGTDFLEKDAVLAYDDDAELNIISSKTTLNKIISHEPIRVNAKFKQPFVTTPNCLLIVGTNEPVQLSPNSGMNRRLIDIRPTGNKLSPDEYDACIEQLKFEKSGIAFKCLQKYKKLGRHYYDHYIAEDMLNRTSPFQNFVLENYIVLKDGISLAKAYKLYSDYAEECKFKNVLARYKFRDTLKLYFDSYDNMTFSGFKPERIGIQSNEPKEENDSEQEQSTNWLTFNSTKSLFDTSYSDMPAQYANDEGLPRYKWENVKTKLKDLDTTKLHYMKVPSNLICIDFDIKGKDGEKDFYKNLAAANKFPPTYAELSKSKQGIHLYYIYTGGNPEDLSSTFDDNVEVKVFTGNSSLRRMVSLCNDIAISVISSGLPLKERNTKMIDWEGFKSEQQLRKFIINCIEKKHHGHTKPEIDFIYTKLNDLYNKGVTYDVRDLQINVFDFALNSNNNAQYCMNLVNQMHFCSKDVDELENKQSEDYEKASIIFLDCEVSPSYKQAKAAGVDIPDNIPENTPALFLINWKFQGDGKKVVRMINPKPSEVAKLFNFRIVTFNGRKYDNHMLWARSQGYSSEELYNLSQEIIDNNPDAKFAQAYNISYTDIYDYSTKKQSLKKWEIELGINHVEWNYPWYIPVPVRSWEKFAEYCDNDVISTEAVFNATKGDFDARCILAKLAHGTPNDTTNNLSTKWVKGDEDILELVYTDFSTGMSYGPGIPYKQPILTEEEYRQIGDDWTGVKPKNSNHFPGYHLVRFADGSLHNMYRGEDVGRGGLVVANPGMYGRGVTKDVASMHPHSIKELNLFGKQTVRYTELMEARIAIKHGDFDKVRNMFDGQLAPYLNNPDEAKALSKALKLVLNSVYGMTSSPNNYFEMKDPRNINNIVALRGALVMKTLQHEVELRSFKVIHIKTDSIKIANPTDDILNFIDKFGEHYGYTFEIEHTWNRICLKDNAQFIGLHDFDDPESPFEWDAVGKYFAVPYIFKTLFTHQEITIDDMAETFSVKVGTIHLVYGEGETEKDNFIGRVGQFTPMTKFGGTLYRVSEGKRYAVSGTKGYLWAETAIVKSNHWEDYVDKSYYQTKCDEAVDTIKSLGNYEWFVSGNEEAK